MNIKVHKVVACKQAYSRMLYNHSGIDWSYPKHHISFGNWGDMTEDEANAIPWTQVTRMASSLLPQTNIRTINFEFTATNLSDRLPSATKVMLNSCPMHSFMMGAHDRLGGDSPVRLMEGHEEIYTMIKGYTQFS